MSTTSKSMVSEAEYAILAAAAYRRCKFDSYRVVVQS